MDEVIVKRHASMSNTAGHTKVRVPRIQSRFRIEVVPPDLVFFLSEHGSEVVRGELFASLLQLVDGQRTATEIATEMPGKTTALDVEYGLHELTRRRLIGDGAPRPRYDARPSPQARKQAQPGAPPATATRAATVVLSHASPAALRSLLERLGIVADEGASPAVVMVDDYLDPKVSRFHLEALRRHRPWLPLKLTGEVLWLGPVLDPPATPCWACLAERLRWNRPIESFLERQAHRRTVAVPAVELPAHDPALGLDRAVFEILSQLVRNEPDDPASSLVTLDLRTRELARHPVSRRPDCPFCGDTRAQPCPPRPVELANRAATFSSDGGYRSLLPEETLARLTPLVSPVTGVVRSLERRGARSGSPVHVYVARPSVPGRFEDWSTLSGVLNLGCAGKGLTRTQARVSALAEAIERSCGIFRGDEVAEVASFEALGDAAVHPNHCLLISERQYRERERWNEGASRVSWIPLRFDERRSIAWSQLWSLTERRWKYLPTSLCYYAYPTARDPEFCRADSNGCAAGNNLEEAILQGFFELVERDAVALWWYNRARRPPFDPTAIDNPYIHGLLAEYAASERSVRLLDLTTDLGIPVVAAIARRADEQGDPAIMGFGAHASLDIAIGRALTELNQFLPSSRREPPTAEEPELANTAWLEHGDEPRATSPALPEPTPATDLRELIEHYAGVLRQQGLEMLVLDQTRAGHGLDVVRVVVPGLRPWWPRFAPGRLYDLPVALGWLEQPGSESRLPKEFPSR